MANIDGLPSYVDIAFALCDIMDGMRDHEIRAETGLSDEDCKKIADIRKALEPYWINEDRTFGGQYHCGMYIGPHGTEHEKGINE